MAEWLGLQLKSGARVGVDPRLIAHTSWTALESDLGMFDDNRLLGEILS